MKAIDLKEPESEALIPPTCRQLFNKLFKYQKLTVNWILTNFLRKSKQFENFRLDDEHFFDQTDPFGTPDGLLVGHSPGLGKTPISCFTLKVLFELKQIRFAIIIVPKTVLNQWVQHMGTWCSGDQSKRKHELESFFRGVRGVVLSSYKIVDTDCEQLGQLSYQRALQLQQKLESKLTDVQKPLKQNKFKELIQQEMDLFELSDSQSKTDLDYIPKDELKSETQTVAEPTEPIVTKVEQIIDLNLIEIEDDDFDGSIQKSEFLHRYGISFDFLILDEATEIKNHKSRVNISLSTIPVFFKICLTGTPIMNNMTELYNIFEFLHPGFLGNRGTFNKTYKKYITQSQLRDASQFDQIQGRKYQKALLDAIAPLFFRRTKEQLRALDIHKHELFIFMDMNEIQEQMYSAFLKSEKFREELIEQFENKTVPFQFITILRKICDNMMRINKTERYFLEKDASRELLQLQKQFFEMFKKANLKVDLKDIQVDEEQDEKEFVNVLQQIDDENETDTTEVGQFQELNIYLSAKQVIMNEILNSFVKQKKKVLIFTEHTTTLNLIQVQLNQLNINNLRIDGKVTSTQERNRICQKFNTDPSVSVFLMTIKVGGMGLNLQAAERVILFSPNWNPSVEEQAIGRAYRLGQKNDVFVYRFCIRNSIEERLIARQFHKQQVAEAMNQDGTKMLKVRQQDIAELFQRDIGNIQDSLLFDFAWIDDENEKILLKNIQDNNQNLKVEFRFVNRLNVEQDEEQVQETNQPGHEQFLDQFDMYITTIQQLRAMGGNTQQNYSKWKDAVKNPDTFLNKVMKQVLDEKQTKPRKHKQINYDNITDSSTVFKGTRDLQVLTDSDDDSTDDLANDTYCSDILAQEDNTRVEPLQKGPFDKIKPFKSKQNRIQKIDDPDDISASQISEDTALVSSLEDSKDIDQQMYPTQYQTNLLKTKLSVDRFKSQNYSQKIASIQQQRTQGSRNENVSPLYDQLKAQGRLKYHTDLVQNPDVIDLESTELVDEGTEIVSLSEDK